MAGLSGVRLARWWAGWHRWCRHRQRGCGAIRPGVGSRPLPLWTRHHRTRSRSALGLRHPQRCPLHHPLRTRLREWTHSRTRCPCLRRHSRCPRWTPTGHPIVVITGHDFASGFVASATRPVARRRTVLPASVDMTSVEKADPAWPPKGIRRPPRWPRRRQEPPPTGAESAPTRRKNKRNTPIRPRQRTHPSRGVLALSAVGRLVSSGAPIPHHQQ